MFEYRSPLTLSKETISTSCLTLSLQADPGLINFPDLATVPPISVIDLADEPVKQELNSSEFKISSNKSLAYYKKVHSYLIRTKVHKYYTLQDTIDHVDGVLSWKAPRELEERFPYYLSGYDYDDQPVWIGEVGKFDVRGQIQRGPEAAKNLSLYLYTFFYNVLDSMQVKDTPEREIRRAVFVGDFEDFDVTQASHIPTLQFALHEYLLYRNVLGLWVSNAIGFNISYLAELRRSLQK
ncbi:unnamed protein product [Allacma fusca]|uniref:Uncharacterized protein n=1 Tax=Allacma fusca TaxID=39272 RepID=A0A8J2PDQ2_9HEXA|nr:unnamed protein product [Allacma fusca]